MKPSVAWKSLSVFLLASVLSACGKSVSTVLSADENLTAGTASEVQPPAELSQGDREKYGLYDGGYFDVRWGEDYLGTPSNEDGEGVEFQMAFIIQPGLLYRIYGNSVTQTPTTRGTSNTTQVFGASGGRTVSTTSNTQPVAAKGERVSLCISVVEQGGSDPRTVALIKERAEKALRGWMDIAESHAWANQNKKNVRGVDVGDKPGCRPINITLHHSFSSAASKCFNGRACAFASGQIYLPNNAYSTSERTITHELGHVLGLGDTYEEAGYIQLNKAQPPSVMNGKSATFTSDDRTGVLLIMDSLQAGLKIPNCGRGYTMDYTGKENKNNNRYCLPTETNPNTPNTATLPGSTTRATTQPQTQPAATAPRVGVPSNPVSGGATGCRVMGTGVVASSGACR